MTELLLKLSLFGISMYFQTPQIPIAGPEIRQFILYAAPCTRDLYADIHPGPYPFPLETSETLCWSCDGRCYRHTFANVAY